MPHFMIVLLPYTNLLNLSWMKNVYFEAYETIKRGGGGGGSFKENCSLQKHAYPNIQKISPPKTEYFQIKKTLDTFHISAQNIDCGYSLEPPQRGGSNEYPHSMFMSRNNKK